MPAAISISVIELSLCGQSHAANHWPLWLVVLSVLVLAPGHPCGSGWSALAPITPFDMSGHVKNGFALDWRSDLRINTQRYTKSDGRRMKDKEQGTWHVLWKKGLRSQSSAPRPSKWYKNCQLEVSIHWQIAAIDVGGLKTLWLGWWADGWCARKWANKSVTGRKAIWSFSSGLGAKCFQLWPKKKKVRHLQRLHQ